MQQRDRSTRGQLQRQLGRLGEVQPYRYHTDPAHRAVGWYATPAGGGPDLFLGSNSHAAWSEVARLLEQTTGGRAA